MGYGRTELVEGPFRDRNHWLSPQQDLRCGFCSSLGRPRPLDAHDGDPLRYRR